MQIILKYVADAVNFRHLAAIEKDPEAKARLEKQAAAYMNLATDRANKIGVPPPKIPDEINEWAPQLAASFIMSGYNGCD
jgi:hypothetical protein